MHMYARKNSHRLIQEYVCNAVTVVA